MHAIVNAQYSNMYMVCDSFVRCIIVFNLNV